MSEKESEGSGFRVVDKRRFDDSGDTRPGETDSGRNENVRPMSEEKPKSASQPQPQPQSTARSAPQAQQRSASGTPQEENASGVDFASLVMSLATQALVMMGEIPSPDGSRGSRNLDGAQQTIDIIALLREKTQGNLTQEEERLIDEVLAQLRLAFVHSVGK